VTEKFYTISSSGGSFTLNYDMYGIPDKADIYLNNVLVSSTNQEVSYTGTLTVPSTVALQAGDIVRVVMTGTNTGTAWDYSVNYSGGVQSLNYVAAGNIVNDDTSGTNIIYGTSGIDNIIGTTGIDQIFAYAANDTIDGNGGKDSIDGGTGIDTAVYHASRSLAYITKTATDTFSITLSGTDLGTLTNVERLQFSDSKLALDLNGNAGITAKILGATFGVSAVTNKGYAGIGIGLLDSGMSYENLATLAINAAGASTPQQVVNLLWTNVVGSAPTAADAQVFVDMLNGGMTTGQLGMLAAETPLNQTNINLSGLSLTGLDYL
jgi:Ca2+-binding RTX toxin-like protein